MALGDPYAVLDELKNRLGITDNNDDARLLNALLVASRGIDKTCARQFNDAGSATARKFRTDDSESIDVDDFSTTTGLIIAVDDDDDGTFETTWAASDYELDPVNGIMDGETGWPYFRVLAVGTRYSFPRYNAHMQVQVTARWGWTSVPAPIKEATLVIAEETFKLKDAPFGVAGWGEFGAVRIRQNPLAMGMIAPYRRTPVLVG